MSSEQNVPAKLDRRCRDLLLSFHKNGPTNIRGLISRGFTYSTYKPHLDDLLSRGLVRHDERGWFRLTPMARPYLMIEEAKIPLWQRAESTNRDNVVDLGFFDEAIATLKSITSPEPPLVLFPPIPLDSPAGRLETNWRAVLTKYYGMSRWARFKAELSDLRREGLRSRISDEIWLLFG